MSTPHNPWKALQDLVGGPPVVVGIVLSIDDGAATIELPGGGQLVARGPAEVGQHVYVAGDVIQGEAPDLPIEIIDL